MFTMAIIGTALLGGLLLTSSTLAYTVGGEPARKPALITLGAAQLFLTLALCLFIFSCWTGLIKI